MKALTDSERTALITKLTDAPDDILLAAVRDMKRRYCEIKDDMKELNGFVGIRFTEAPKLPFESRPVLDVKAVAAGIEALRPNILNIEPPGPAAKRITTASKDAIMSKVRVPATAEQVNKFLGRGAGKLDETKMLLRRLWDLGFILFDGTNYGVKK